MRILRAQPGREDSKLRRRNFLVLGSTLALTPGFLAFSQSLLTDSTVRPLQVSFLEGSGGFWTSGILAPGCANPKSHTGRVRRSAKRSGPCRRLASPWEEG